MPEQEIEFLTSGNDDTVRFQKAYDDAFTSTGSWTIRLGFGEFILSSINGWNKPGVKVRGQGKFNGTKIIPIGYDKFTFECVDTWGVTFSDFTFGRGATPTQPMARSAFLFGMGPDANCNLNTIENVFISDLFHFSAIHDQGTYGLDIVRSSLWNYWPSHTLSKTAYKELESTISGKSLSTDTHPVNGGSVVRSEIHNAAIPDSAGMALYSGRSDMQPLAWSTVIGGAVMARHKYGTTWTRDSWPGLNTLVHISPEESGDSPVWV